MKPSDSASSAPEQAGVNTSAQNRARQLLFCALLILAVTIAAALLRVPRLQQRPMHGDEAVHAIKFGDLLEKNYYRYDPYEFHGPTLNYLTLIPAWLTYRTKLTEVNELTLRIVPVFFGLLLVVLILPVADGLGPRAAVCAAVLTAISPAMVFYSRYYIQEMLLVCFTFGVITCAYRYAQTKKVEWILFTGAFLGLCHATKETCIIAFGSMLLALLLMRLMRSRRDGFVLNAKVVKSSHLIAGLVAAVVVSALFYSSFFSNPTGILDSFRTYTTYFNRAGHNRLHIHPWYYYLKMVLYSRYSSGPVWSEALIVILALVGFVTAFRKKNSADANSGLLRFIAFYTVILTIAYSAIPYKTPWCMLGFLHGMILLAGVGVVALLRLAKRVLPQLLLSLLLLCGGAHLAWQAYRSSYTFYADSCNPYVYAHPTPEVYSIAERIKEVAAVLEEMAVEEPDKIKMHIQFICPGHDYWPLPWYLRDFEEGTIDWWDRVILDAPSAPIIVASPAVEEQLTKKLYELTPFQERQTYFFMFDKPHYYMWLRPNVKLFAYIRKDLWQRLREQ